MSLAPIFLGLFVVCAGDGKLDLKAEGRKVTALLLKADDAAGRELFGKMSAEMKELFSDADGLTKFGRGLCDSLGAEKQVVRERAFSAGEETAYLRVSRFSKSKEPVLALWTFGADGTILGLLVQPDGAGAAATTKNNYKTKTALRFPLQGTWFTFWGGRNAIENYHVVDRGQRFAYDLLILKDGRSHDGDGKVVEQYYAFGKPVLAPADGVVTEAEAGLPDMVPGEMDPAHAMGNHVIIDHGNGEFSFLCHLRRGSVLVKPGDRVKEGQKLADCGNSGNTSEPHLHYHLQDSGKFGEGDGLPAPFRDVVIDGKKAGRAEPLRGQTVAPQEGQDR